MNVELRLWHDRSHQVLALLIKVHSSLVALDYQTIEGVAHFYIFEQC